jgi:hypothetical protein
MEAIGVNALHLCPPIHPLTHQIHTYQGCHHQSKKCHHTPAPTPVLQPPLPIRRRLNQFASLRPHPSFPAPASPPHNGQPLIPLQFCPSPVGNATVPRTRHHYASTVVWPKLLILSLILSPTPTQTLQSIMLVWATSTILTEPLSGLQSLPNMAKAPLPSSSKMPGVGLLTRPLYSHLRHHQRRVSRQTGIARLRA